MLKCILKSSSLTLCPLNDNPLGMFVVNEQNIARLGINSYYSGGKKIIFFYHVKMFQIIH